MASECVCCSHWNRSSEWRPMICTFAVALSGLNRWNWLRFEMRKRLRNSGRMKLEEFMVQFENYSEYFRYIGNHGVVNLIYPIILLFFYMYINMLCYVISGNLILYCIIFFFNCFVSFIIFISDPYVPIFKPLTNLSLLHHFK